MRKGNAGQPVIIDQLESRELNASIPVSAGGSIADALRQAVAGDVLQVAAGTFSFNGTIPTNVTVDGAGQGETIIKGKLRVAGTLSDLTVDGAGISSGRQLQSNFAQVTTMDGAVLRRITQQNYEGTGVGAYGKDVTIEYVTVKNNGTNGIGSDSGVNITLNHVTVQNNANGWTLPSWAGVPNTFQSAGKWYIDPRWEGGGGKWYNTVGLTIKGSDFNANGGPGIWLDGYNRGYRIIGNEVRNNSGPSASWAYMGIASELSYDGLIEGNYVHDTTGSGIGVMETKGATVKNNTVFGSVEFRAIPGRGIALENATSTANAITGGIYITIGTKPATLSLSDDLFANQAGLNSAIALGERNGRVAQIVAPNLNVGATSDQDPTPQPPPPTEDPRLEVVRKLVVALRSQIDNLLVQLSSLLALLSQ